MKTGSGADEFKPDWFVYEQMATFLQSVNFKKNEKFRGKFEYLFFNSITSILLTICMYRSILFFYKIIFL